MEWSWFDLAFPWIGLADATMLLIVLFGTNFLRSEHETSRWRDPVWLSWLAMAVYLVHNVEEYGIDLYGHFHAFPDALCGALKLPGYPDCPMPPLFFLAVNIPLFWIGAPISALLGKRYPIAALTFYGVIFINALVHIAPLFAVQHYGPGLLTAVFLFLPLSVWVAYVCFGQGKLGYKALLLLVANGVLLHIILMGSMFLFIRGFIGSTILVAAQVINAILFVLIPFLLDKWRSSSEGNSIARSPK